MSAVLPPCVPLFGPGALLVARGMRHALDAGVFDGLHDTDRRRLEGLVADVEQAGRLWQVDRDRRCGNSETARAETGARSAAMDIDDAAELWGVTPRRARQLAASGLGVKVDGRWRVDQALALAEADRRVAS